MAVKIRLKRMGKIHAPFYRVVVMDSRTKRDGRAIEEIGKYHPTEEPSLIDISSERAQYWLAQGAQPTEAVAALLKVTGDWQRFRGVDGAEGTLRVKDARRSKREVYEAAVAAVGARLDTKDRASTARKRAEPKAAEPAPAAAEPVAEPATTEPAAAEPVAEPPVAEPATTEPAAAEPAAEPPVTEPGTTEPADRAASSAVTAAGDGA